MLIGVEQELPKMLFMDITTYIAIMNLLNDESYSASKAFDQITYFALASASSSNTPVTDRHPWQHPRGRPHVLWHVLWNVLWKNEDALWRPGIPAGGYSFLLQIRHWRDTLAHKHKWELPMGKFKQHHSRRLLLIVYRELWHQQAVKE